MLLFDCTLLSYLFTQYLTYSSCSKVLFTCEVADIEDEIILHQSNSSLDIVIKKDNQSNMYFVKTGLYEMKIQSIT